MRLGLEGRCGGSGGGGGAVEWWRGVRRWAVIGDEEERLCDDMINGHLFR